MSLGSSFTFVHFRLKIWNKIDFRAVAAAISLFPVSDPHGGSVLVGGGVFGGCHAGGGGSWI